LQRCSQPAPDLALVVGELAAELFAEDALLGNDLEAGDHQDEEWWAKKGQRSGEVNRPPEENGHKAEVHGVAGVAVNAGHDQVRGGLGLMGVDGRAGSAEGEEARERQAKAAGKQYGCDEYSDGGAERKMR
jgi:hypothetical protein